MKFNIHKSESINDCIYSLKEYTNIQRCVNSITQQLDISINAMLGKDAQEFTNYTLSDNRFYIFRISAFDGRLIPCAIN